METMTFCSAWSLLSEVCNKEASRFVLLSSVCSLNEDLCDRSSCSVCGSTLILLQRAEELMILKGMALSLSNRILRLWFILSSFMNSNLLLQVMRFIWIRSFASMYRSTVFSQRYPHVLPCFLRSSAWRKVSPVTVERWLMRSLFELFLRSMRLYSLQTTPRM